MTVLPEEEGFDVETPPEQPSRWWIWLVVTAAALGFVFYVLQPVMVLPRGKQALARQIQDINDLRQIVGIMLSRNDPAPLAKDGRIDVYRILRREQPDTRQIQDILHSSRADAGPSIAEIEAGDYSNYAYQRHLGPIDPRSSERVPVIWEREPTGGEQVVAYSDGSVRAEPEPVMREWVRAHPEQE